MSGASAHRDRMTDAALRTTVRTLLAAGRLPRDPARQMRATYGDGARCDVCAQPTESSSVAYTMRLGSGVEARSVVMHCTCFDVWEGERGVISSDEATVAGQ